MTSKPLVAGAPRTDMSEAGSFPAVTMVDALPIGHATSAYLRDGGDGEAWLRGPDRRRVALLARALESEVIPRLVLSRHQTSDPPYRADPKRPGPTRADVEGLTGYVICGDLSGAAAFVADLRARNLPIERIFLEVFAPTARLLGEMWETDRCDFASVTIGLCCLQQLVLDHGQSAGLRAGRRNADRRILLAPVPGEQHSFGLVMVGEFFRRQGWDVCSGTGAGGGELVATVRMQWFSMVGFSLACESRLDALATLIRDIRRASRNPHVGILVGGRLFSEQPERAAMVGADATSADGQQAVLKAETLLALLVQEA